MSKVTRVGVGIIAVNTLYSLSGRIILGKRKGRGAGLWAVPGGRVEDESPIDAAYRELAEETGLQGYDLRPLGFTDIGRLSTDEPYYVNIWYVCKVHGSPFDMEPDRHEGWQCVEPRMLPHPLFPKTQEAIDKYLEY